ncbi:MAG: voltage-gated potassium channel [Verrucomicrobia bacterium]|jgi:voltage-gated potassium channel|nr:MAG: voltage-gated potassium channel [Verrucomicrobiota bacterium]
MAIERDEKGRPFFGPWEAAIQALILLNLAAFALETLPDLNARTIQILNGFEIFSALVFVSEYALRIFWSRPRLSYPLSFFGIIDLVSILPSLLTLNVDLRSLRIVRLLRLVRLLKLVRYGPVIRRFERAFEIARDELAVFGAISLAFLYLAAVGIYHFEHEAQPEVFSSVFHSLWWATTTFTTVGYGDAYPVTPGGRLFTFVVLVFGLGIVAVPTGLIATALTKARDEEREAARETTKPARRRRTKS